MREMTLKEYCWFMLQKELGDEAAKHGIKIVETKSKPQVVKDNVVRIKGDE